MKGFKNPANFYQWCIKQGFDKHGAVLIVPPEARAFSYVEMMKRVGEFTPIIQVRG